jgi:hypothetical protein
MFRFLPMPRDAFDSQRHRRERKNKRLDHLHLANKFTVLICPRFAFAGEFRATRRKLGFGAYVEPGLGP